MIYFALIVAAALFFLWLVNSVIGYAGIYSKGLGPGAKAFFGHLLRRP